MERFTAAINHLISLTAVMTSMAICYGCTKTIDKRENLYQYRDERGIPYPLCNRCTSQYSNTEHCEVNDVSLDELKGLVTSVQPLCGHFMEWCYNLHRGFYYRLDHECPECGQHSGLYKGNIKRKILDNLKARQKVIEDDTEYMDRRKAKKQPNYWQKE